MRSFLFLALVSVAACAAQDIDDTDQLDAPAGKADASSKPAGMYTNAAPHAGDLVSLSLGADHTFTAKVLVECIAAPCNPVETRGTFLFTHGTSHGTTRHYIRLYGEDGSSINRFQWKLDVRGQLALEADGSSHWFTMQEGGSCEAAGGTCVPLVPDACYIGSVGDATQYSCGGGLGVECCLRPPRTTAVTPRATARACSRSSAASAPTARRAARTSRASRTPARSRPATSACARRRPRRAASRRRSRRTATRAERIQSPA